jgi:hypothetical protein
MEKDKRVPGTDSKAVFEDGIDDPKSPTNDKKPNNRVASVQSAGSREVCTRHDRPKDEVE